MRKIVLGVGLALALTDGAANAAFAFETRCGGHAIACYDRMRVPPAYATRTYPVLVNPAWREVIASPPVVAHVAVPVMVRPGRWRTLVRPPVYGTRMERVVVAPPIREYEIVPPITRRVEKTITTRGGIVWERRRDIFGRERLCKVVVGPRRRTVVREVVVRPARRILHTSPAVYGIAPAPVLLRPASAVRVYEPPVRAVIGRTVLAQPSAIGIIPHPATVGIARERVLVRPAGYAWVRTPGN